MPAILTNASRDAHEALAPRPDRARVGTSISSDGDGRDAAAELAELQAHNAGVRLLDRHRGYVACTVTPREWRSDFRAVDVVTRADAQPRTVASFVVQAGRAGVHRV